MANETDTSKTNASKASENKEIREFFEQLVEENQATSLNRSGFFELAEQMIATEARISALEAALKEAKNNLAALTEFVIPETLIEAGCHDDKIYLRAPQDPVGFTFRESQVCESGEQRYLTISTEYCAKIRSAAQEEAARWLADRGYGDKVTRKEVIGIHAQTLKKAMRESVEEDFDFSKEQELKHLFGLYLKDKATIKIQKAKSSK